MRSFETYLDDISLTKLLNYFGYRKLEETPFFNIYSSESSRHRYYLFSDENEKLQVFDLQRYLQVTKTDLLFSISGASSIAEAMEIIPSIKDFVPLDTNSLKPTKLTSVVNVIANLREVDQDLLPLIKTAQFKRKVFLSPDNQFTTPLFSYNIDQMSSNRITNIVKWNDTDISFINANSSCLNASNHLPENKFLFITSSPGAWLKFPTLNYAPDYFLILCHPKAPLDFIELLNSIFNKFKFSQFHLHISDDALSNEFFCNVFGFLLSKYYSRFFFRVNYHNDHYSVEVFSNNVRESNIELAKIFGELNFSLQEEFLQGYLGEIEVNESLENVFSVKSMKVKFDDKAVSIEKVSRNPRIAAKFFNAVLSNLKLSEKIKVIVV